MKRIDRTVHEETPIDDGNVKDQVCGGYSVVLDIPYANASRPPLGDRLEIVCSSIGYSKRPWGTSRGVCLPKAVMDRSIFTEPE